MLLTLFDGNRNVYIYVIISRIFAVEILAKKYAHACRSKLNIGELSFSDSTALNMFKQLTSKYQVITYTG